MRERDKAIIDDLRRFRCLSRDDIADLHFKAVKDPVREANSVLLRLRRMGEISVSKERRQYVYFPDKSIKRDSTKIPHFLRIAEFYREIRKHADPRIFQVEPKYGSKGMPEPDIFMFWKGRRWFVEIQRNHYTEKQWSEKMKRYERYYASAEWMGEDWEWQSAEKKFPYVWIVGKGRSADTSFRVVQGDVDEIIGKLK